MMVINPVIERELKTKMRKWRAPMLLAFYLTILGLVFFSMTNSYDNYGYGGFNPTIIIDTFSVLAMIQMGLILLIVPSITSSSINGERERQTLDLMLCTNFSTYSILNGKIIVSILHVILLIIAAMPFFGIAFLYGGVDFIDLVKLLGFYLSSSLLFASSGIYFSTLFRKSRVSSMVTYIYIMISVIGTLFIFSILLNYILRASMGLPYGGDIEGSLYQYFMFINPFYALSSILPSGGGGGLFGMFSYGSYGVNLYQKSVFLSPFAKSLYYNTVCSLIFYILAAERLKPVKKRLFGGKR